MDDWSSIRLCDVVNLILGGVLFFSPWLFDLSSGAQWQTASTAGIIIAVLSIAALAAFAVWEEWFILFAGIALIVAPWLLGFQNSDAMIIDVVIGMAVAVLAGCEIPHNDHRLSQHPSQHLRTTKRKGDSACPPFQPLVSSCQLGEFLGVVDAPVIWRRSIGQILGKALVAHGSRHSRNSYLPIARVERGRSGGAIAGNPLSISRLACSFVEFGSHIRHTNNSRALACE